MQLTRKQTILIIALSGLVLILTVAAALLLPSGGEDAAPSPDASPTQTPSPAPTSAPSPSPSPTIFRLPLVPQWDTPQPSREPAGVFAPQTAPPAPWSGPWAGADDGDARDMIAVGLRDGRAAALLFLRLTKDRLTAAALPAEETPLIGDDLKAQGEQAAALAAAAAGRSCGHWLALDLACLPALLQVTGPLGEADAASLTGSEGQRAKAVLDLAAGAVTYVQRFSLLKLPALKRAVGDAFGSNLTVRELWSLFWTVRNGVTFQGCLPPV